MKLCKLCNIYIYVTVSMLENSINKFTGPALNSNIKSAGVLPNDNTQYKKVYTLIKKESGAGFNFKSSTKSEVFYCSASAIK